MSKDLQEQWPYVVETKRKYGRPQHSVKYSWRKFDTPLIRRSDIDWDNLDQDMINMKIKEVDQIKSDHLRKDVKNFNNLS